MVDKRERRQIMIRIGDIFDERCKPCEHRSANYNTKGCQTCKIGQQLMKYGEMLNHKNPTFKIEKGEEIMTLTVAEYSKMKEDGKPDKVIGELYGMDSNALYRFKKANNLIGEFDAKKKETKAEKKAKESAEKEAPANQYAQLMDELKQQLVQKTDLADKLQEKIAHFETGVEQYKQALAEERLKYKALEEAFEDVEAENEKLRRELESPAIDESIISENKQLRNENEALQVQISVFKQALKVVL